MSENLDPQLSRGLGTSPHPIQRTNTNFQFPTEVISLPSKGLVYPESNPLSKGEITIKLLTAKEEDILTSPNLIKKGIHLDRLLESIVVEPGVNINDLMVGDKNAILVSTRVLAFGPKYEIVIVDKDTGDDTPIAIDLGNVQIKEVDDSILNRNNEYDFTLPKSGIAIKFKLLTHGDEVAINKDIEAMEKLSGTGNEITTRFRRIITEINGNRDTSNIADFVSNKLQVMDSRALRKYITTITPDLDLTFQHTYPISGETEALRIPFGFDFFYPTI
jgi:hypothetical protein